MPRPPRTVFRRLRQLAHYRLLGAPLWFLLGGLAFIALVDWLTGGRLSH